MKDDRITFRLTKEQKERLVYNAKKENMGISEYIISCIKDRNELNDLNDSEGQFLRLFDTAYNKSSSIQNKKTMVLLNKINFNVEVLIRVMNTFMKQLKIPQNKDDVITTFIDHPIITISEDQVLKEHRNKKGTDNNSHS